MKAQRILSKLLAAGSLSLALCAGAPAATVGADPCLGLANCTSSGPLLARVVGTTASTKGNNHFVTLRVQFRNLGSGPLILNYKKDTGEIIDERGQSYIVDSRSRDSVQGMPVSTRTEASSAFTLAPGETRTAAFRYYRYVGKVPAGTVFQPSMSVEQYKLLSANQLQLERDYLLSFGEVRAGLLSAPNGDELQKVVDGLGELFKKK